MLLYLLDFSLGGPIWSLLPLFMLGYPAWLLRIVFLLPPPGFLLEVGWFWGTFAAAECRTFPFSL